MYIGCYSQRHIGVGTKPNFIGKSIVVVDEYIDIETLYIVQLHFNEDI